MGIEFLQKNVNALLEREANTGERILQTEEKLRQLENRAEDAADSRIGLRARIDELKEGLSNLSGQDEMAESIQDNTHRLIGLEKRFENVKRTAAEEIQSLQEQIDALKETVEEYRQNQARCNCNIEFRVKRLDTHYDHLTALEQAEPSKEDKACKETDFWLQTHEDRLADLERRVNNIEPKDKQDGREPDKAETIRRARKIVSLLLEHGYTMKKSEANRILAALSIAEESNKEN